MKNKDSLIKAFDFSKLGRELTEDELYIINGGAQIENSNEAVANAQVGDTLTRKDGTIVTINQGDILFLIIHQKTLNLLKVHAKQHYFDALLR